MDTNQARKQIRADHRNGLISKTEMRLRLHRLDKQTEPAKPEPWKPTHKIELYQSKPTIHNGWTGQWKCKCGEKSPWFTARSWADAAEAIRQYNESRDAHACEHATAAVAS